MSAVPKRSHSPIFWLLFGAGGMLAALLGPALSFITLAAPNGWLFGSGLLAYPRVLALAQHALPALVLWAVASLFAWHAVHRILCSLHDVGIHKTFGVKLVCYGVAMAITVVSASALLAL